MSDTTNPVDLIPQQSIQAITTDEKVEENGTMTRTTKTVLPGGDERIFIKYITLEKMQMEQDEDRKIIDDATKRIDAREILLNTMQDKISQKLNP